MHSLRSSPTIEICALLRHAIIPRFKSRTVQAARLKPKHAVKLSFIVEGDGNAELRPLLDSSYKWDSEKKRYFLTMDKEVTLYWWFNESEGWIECELIPHAHEPVVEAGVKASLSASEMD